MGKVIKDIFGLQRVLNNEMVRDYGNIYYHSNERLKDIFKNVDVEDKNVLTVLASGDHVFYAYDNGAKNVDCFDINKLAVHYFYLRKWVINYMDSFYPNDLDMNYIKKLLKLVKTNNPEERTSLRFWKAFLICFSDEDLYDLLCYSTNPLANNIKDVGKIKERINNDDINIYNIDISKRVKIGKRYDVIFTSNISDYIKHDYKSYRLYRDSLDSLLSKEGKIVCSNVLRGRASYHEKEVFEKRFNLEYLPYIKVKSFEGSPGYVYTRKC